MWYKRYGLSELWIRGGFEDNSKVIVLIKESIFCGPSLEPSPQDGSNEGSQHVFIEKLRNIFSR